MNKRLDLETAQKVAEKRGYEWALTSFARNAYDLTKEGYDVFTKPDERAWHRLRRSR